MPEKPPCGTVQAYRRHLKDQEPPCGPCKRAKAAYQADWQQRKREETFAQARESHPQPPVAAVNVRDDLLALRGDLVSAIAMTMESDPTRVAPLARELREVLKQLEPKEAPSEEGGLADEIARARAARKARAAGSQSS